MRDWSRGQALGFYRIHPLQFNTRRPLHINDDDLCPTSLNIDIHGCIDERPRFEFTMLSYTLHALEIASFARMSIDLRGPLRQGQRQEETNELVKMRNHLNSKYEEFIAGLPSYFRLGSTVGLTSTDSMAAIPVHRWMLHQQLWSLFLRLHRPSLSSQGSGVSCQLLAQNIISTQAQIQARCAVCGSLSTSETQLFNAAIVLLVCLLFSAKHKDADPSGAQLNRLMTRDKVLEAIELLRTPNHAAGSLSTQNSQSERLNPSAEWSVVALETLMKLEEDESGSNEESNTVNSTGNPLEGRRLKPERNASKSLKSKVMDILAALQAKAKNAARARAQAGSNSFPILDTSVPLSTATGEFHDLDIMPMLSNYPSSDFWPFLDFAPPPESPTESGSLSVTADLQNFVNFDGI